MKHSDGDRQKSSREVWKVTKLLPFLTARVLHSSSGPIRERGDVLPWDEIRVEQ
jgi:hypothetical protein